MRVDFSFAIRLGSVRPHDPPGARFHRWLPNSNDAIQLASAVPIENLVVWFEQRCIARNGMINYDREGSQVDATIAAKQGVLEAGPLFGAFSVELSKASRSALNRPLVNDAAYVKLAKRLVKVLHPEIEQFVDLFRFRFGQHWIAPFASWDSARGSLGAYCSGINLRWRDGDSWRPFVPTVKVSKFDGRFGPRSAFREYITQNDWTALPAYVRAAWTPSPAVRIAQNSHRLLDEDEHRLALIEAVTALEVAIHELLNASMTQDTHRKAAQEFWNRGLRSQLAVCLALRRGLTEQQMADALEAVQVRHELVHQAVDAPLHTERLARAALRAVSHLAPGAQGIKFAHRNIGNVLTDEWDEMKVDLDQA